MTELLEGKSFLPLSNRACFELHGADRLTYLQGQTTQDFKSLQINHARHAAVCNAKGKMQGDLIASRFEDFLRLDMDVSLAESLPARLEKYMIAEEVSLTPSPSCVWGFHRIGSEPPSTSDRWSWGASNRFGLPGWDGWSDTPPPEAWKIASTTEAECFRICCGIPKWGLEMNENTLPPEVLREGDSISYQKGCYIGQETIARIKSIGRVNKKLCLLECLMEPDQSPVDLFFEDKLIGTLTSISDLPDETGKWTALGVLPVSILNPGVAFESSTHRWTLRNVCV